MSKTRDIADSAEVINYLDTVTSNVQDQIDTKASATNGTFTGTVTADGLSLGDDDKATFGNSNDLEIYHDGSNSYISDLGTGSLRILAQDFRVRTADNTGQIITGIDGGQVNLYHNNNLKFKTTSTGIDVTGTVTADGVSLGDDAIASFGAGNDLQIYHDSATNQTLITETGAGNLRLQASQLVLQNAGGTKNYFIGLDSGASILYHDNNAKISTTSTGADVTGTVTATAFEGDGSGLTGIDTLPSQTTNAGKYLTTDGTNASWATLTTDPTKATLSKTFLENETYQLTLSEPITSGCPVVSVTKEIPQENQTNNTWDVNSSSNNYIREDSAYDTTLDWVGDFSQTSYSSKSVNVSAQDGTPLGLTFKPDGTKMYMVGNGSDSVNEYNLSTAFDVSTATYSQSFSVSSQDTVPAGVAFNLDGSKMFITGGQNDSAYEYSLSTSYDVSTASYVRSFNTSSQDTDARSITFNLDGTKMFLGGNSSASVLEYNLSTAFDLSTASYSQSFSFSSQSSGCGGIAFNHNGTELYVSSGDAAGSWVYKYNLSTAFDVSTASYSSVALNVSSQDANPFGIAFNRNGSLLFVLGLTNKIIYQYDIATSLALGTGSFASADVGKTIEANSGEFVLTATDGSYVETTAPTSYDQVASGDWSMYNLVYDTTSDNLKVSGADVGSANVGSFSVGANTTDYLYRFALPGHSSNAITISCWLNVNALATTNQAWCFTGGASENDGLHLVYGTATGQAILYDGAAAAILDVAAITAGEWNHIAISAVSGTQEVYFNGQFAGTANRTFTSITGPWDLLIGQEPDSHTLGSAWGNFSAAQSLNGQIARMRIFDRTITAAEALLLYKDNTSSPVHDIFGDGSIAATYLLESNGQDLGTAGLDLTQNGGSFVTNFPVITSRVFASGYSPAITAFSINTEYWNDINTMTVDDIPGDGSISYALSNDDRTTWSVVDNAGTRDIVRNNAGTWQYNSNATYASETWVNGTTNTELATLAEAMEGAASGYDIANASYDSVSLDISAQITQVKGMSFNNDGSKMYIVDNSGDGIREYELSTAYSLGTASYARFFSTSAQETTPNSVVFNSDGTKMFVVGTTGDDVGEYSLSTAFNVATASFTQNLSVSAQDTSPFGIAFNTDGTKMFISADGSNSVLEYALSTGFDISTASYSQNFSVTDTAPRDIKFASSGSVMFLLGAGSDTVYKYSLSTAFDISTASLIESFSVNSQAANPQGMAISADGETMFISDDSSDSVYQYSLVNYLNQMDKTQLDAITDANQITLGDSLDLAIILNIETGVNLPSSDGVSINYDGNVINKGAILGTDYDFDFPASDKVNITALNGNNYKVRIV